MTQFASQLEVVDLLRSRLELSCSATYDGRLMTEWTIIRQRFSDLLTLHGSDGWDFNLMDWPADVPLFNVSVNQLALKDVVPLEEVQVLLVGLDLPWCVRLECLDRIQDGVMTGGKTLRDIVITKDGIAGWEG